LTLRSGKLARPGLDPGGDTHRLDGGDRRHTGIGAPGQKLTGGAGIGAARVRVADVGHEEFEEAHAGAIDRAAATSTGSLGELIGTTWFIPGRPT
jgi:hypothetical protein